MSKNISNKSQSKFSIILTFCLTIFAILLGIFVLAFFEGKTERVTPLKTDEYIQILEAAGYETYFDTADSGQILTTLVSHKENSTSEFSFRVADSNTSANYLFNSEAAQIQNLYNAELISNNTQRYIKEKTFESDNTVYHIYQNQDRVLCCEYDKDDSLSKELYDELRNFSKDKSKENSHRKE